MSQKNLLYTVMAKKAILNDIVIMRLILIALLIIYHSFAPFCGNWAAFDEEYSSPVYFWIGKLSYSFFLEAFVFISGLLAGYNAIIKPIKEQSFQYIIKKVKRLIIPSIVFSIVYFICFYEWNSLPGTIYSILNGCGHLWFLPMLFWCFVALWIVSKINLHNYLILSFAIICALLSNDILPMRIGSAMYYFLFFYIGYLISGGKLKCLVHPHISVIILFSTIFICLFVGKYNMQIYSGLWGGVIFPHLYQVAMSFSGLMATYLIVEFNVPNRCVLPHFLIILSRYSFGIYIMQQFILKYLYYYTSLPKFVDYILVPWIGIIVALLLSIIITHVSIKTRIGHYLLG